MTNLSDYTVLFDAQNAELFESSIAPQLEKSWTVIPFQSVNELSLPSDIKVLFWLGDLPLYELIPHAVEKNWSVGFLPHPDMNRFYRTFPISKKIEEVLEDIKSTEDPVLSDLLFCNEQLVLGSVMLGNPTIMRPASNMDNSIWSKLKYLALMTFNLSKVHLSSYKLQTEKNSVVNTAALGVTFVYRPSGSDFTKRVIGETEVDESSLNAILLAPRSISEVIRFLFSRLFPSKEGAQGFANYIGYIKTSSIEVSSTQSLSYTVDSVPYTNEVVNVAVKPNALKVISSRLPKKLPVEEAKESIRVSTLPKGQAVKELISRPLPWIHHVDAEEVKETFVNLKESAQITESYLMLMVLSTLLATVGLFANSAPVIIGAMILAPLMAPIISLSMGVLRQNIDLISTSIKTLLVGIVLALFFGILLTLITPLQAVTSEISARLSPTILDLAVAIISGIAGAYANARSEVAKSLAGVAIAVALVPPLAVSGIGIGWLDWHTFSAAFLLFITNLVGIVLASTLTFLVMGFSPFHLAKKGVAYALGFVLLVSIPLSFSFKKLVEKQQVISTLEGLNLAGIEVRDVQIRDQFPLYVSVTLLSNKSIDIDQIEKVKKQIEERLNRDIQLESKIAIMR
ncbi:TIGR00341 family protein [Thiomicrorhabdus sp. Kp2]|uniref:TIGR00341 family protein n=1 Tax=Thiomicrorhabdus sp. Kp2 TaxID=1123518 RepID=UPI0004202D53|nr:TIGR00341 family protein [Thiomicrorhabdus sp. Kp2]